MWISIFFPWDPLYCQTYGDHSSTMHANPNFHLTSWLPRTFPLRSILWQVVQRPNKSRRKEFLSAFGTQSLDLDIHHAWVMCVATKGVVCLKSFEWICHPFIKHNMAERSNFLIVKCMDCTTVKYLSFPVFIFVVEKLLYFENEYLVAIFPNCERMRAE